MWPHTAHLMSLEIIGIIKCDFHADSRIFVTQFAQVLITNCIFTFKNTSLIERTFSSVRKVKGKFIAARKPVLSGQVVFNFRPREAPSRLQKRQSVPLENNFVNTQSPSSYTETRCTPRLLHCSLSFCGTQNGICSDLHIVVIVLGCRRCFLGLTFDFYKFTKFDFKPKI